MQSYTAAVVKFSALTKVKSCAHGRVGACRVYNLHQRRALPNGWPASRSAACRGTSRAIACWRCAPSIRPSMGSCLAQRMHVCSVGACLLALALGHFGQQRPPLLVRLLSWVANFWRLRVTGDDHEQKARVRQWAELTGTRAPSWRQQPTNPAVPQQEGKSTERERLHGRASGESER